MVCFLIAVVEWRPNQADNGRRRAEFRAGGCQSQRQVRSCIARLRIFTDISLVSGHQIIFDNKLFFHDSGENCVLRLSDDYWQDECFSG